MTFLTETKSVNNSSIFDALKSYFLNLVKSYEQAQNVRLTIKELSRLSDRELSDIGLSRCDIYTVAMETHKDNYRI